MPYNAFLSYSHSADAAFAAALHLALQRFARQHDVAEEQRIVLADRNAGSGREGKEVRRRRFAAIAAVELGDFLFESKMCAGRFADRARGRAGPDAGQVDGFRLKCGNG